MPRYSPPLTVSDPWRPQTGRSGDLVCGNLGPHDQRAMGNLQPSRRLRFTVRNGARPINSQCDRSRSSDSAALAAVVGQGRGRAAGWAPASPSSGSVPLVGSPASPAAPAAAARASNGGCNGQHEPHALGTLLPGEPRESRLRGGWSGVWAAEVALDGALWLGDVPRPRRTCWVPGGACNGPNTGPLNKCTAGVSPRGVLRQTKTTQWARSRGGD
jgi:hypothetical protein